MINKKVFLILFLLSVNLLGVFAQTPTDSIRVKKSFWGNGFYQGNRKLDMNQLINVMEINPQALKQIKKAQRTNM